MLLGNFTFDQTRQDAELFARVGVLAQQAGAPFLAGAHPHMVDCESLAKTPDPRDWVRAGESKAVEAWTFLRSTQIASYLGLVLPRFLLRLPYGKKTEPTERFDFEELAHGAPPQSYLWGNSAFACTTLLAQAFAQQGWDLRPNSVLELDGLPAHVYQSDDESEMKPCAEVLLVERAIERIAGQGIMPLLSIKGRDNVRLASFFCIAGPGQPLAGRWE